MHKFSNQWTTAFRKLYKISPLTKIYWQFTLKIIVLNEWTITLKMLAASEVKIGGIARIMTEKQIITSMFELSGNYKKMQRFPSLGEIFHNSIYSQIWRNFGSYIDSFHSKLGMYPKIKNINRVCINIFFLSKVFF